MTPDLPPSRISLRDIAKHLGVSHVTVSLALRDNPRISLSMREKVKAAALEMSYQPDPMLAALAHYRRDKKETPITSSIAWINAWPEGDLLRMHKEFDNYWEGAQQAALKAGYRLEEFRQQGELTPQRLDQILSSRGIRGILLPPHALKEGWEGFPWENYSVVKFGRSLAKPSAHIVTANQFGNALLAYREIRKKGYKRIALATDQQHAFDTSCVIEAGYLYGQREDTAAESLPVLDVRCHRSQQWMAQVDSYIAKHRPDAFFTNLPWLPQILPDHYPSDVIGVATTSLMDGFADAGINQNPVEIGRLGFETLNHLMQDGVKGIPQVSRELLVNGHWVDGTSLPVRNA